MAKTKKSDQIKVALVQMSCANDPAGNIAKAVQRIEAAAKTAPKLFACKNCFARVTFARARITTILHLPKRFPGQARKR
jgi:hypothetical protein